MNILYDGKIFQIQHAGGINRYFAEIISRLPAHWKPTLIGVADTGANSPAHGNLRVCHGPDFKRHRLKPLGQRMRQWRWNRHFQKADLFHPTYFELCDSLDIRKVRCPVVVTIYDLIYAAYPKLIDDSDFIVARQREAALRADKIVCISKNTEQDLLDRIPEAAGKTCVIYLGSSFKPEDSKFDRKQVDRANFLYVGARGKYKNFAFLLNAFAAASRTNREIRLRVAGPPLNESELWQVHLLGITNSVDVHVFPDETALKKLYQESLALLYPSHHEGFGIPPLEAMSCGTIAVTANTTSLPEVVGDGGIMLNPSSQSDWADCILQLAQGGIDRNDLIARGYNQARRFSWENTVAQHIELYRQLAG